MIIRRAKIEDAEKLAKLMNLAMLDIVFQFIGKEDIQEANIFLAYFIAQKGNQYSFENIYVAEDNNQIIGQISLYPGKDLITLRKPILSYIKAHYGIDFLAEAETQDGEIYIDTLAVDPTIQGKGVGKSLLEFAIHELVIKEGLTLGLLVDKANPNAKRLYEKVGFTVQNDLQIFGKTMEHMQFVPHV